MKDVADSAERTKTAVAAKYPSYSMRECYFGETKYGKTFFYDYWNNLGRNAMKIGKKTRKMRPELILDICMTTADSDDLLDCIVHEESDGENEEFVSNCQEFETFCDEFSFDNIDWPEMESSNDLPEMESSNDWPEMESSNDWTVINKSKGAWSKSPRITPDSGLSLSLSEKKMKNSNKNKIGGSRLSSIGNRRFSGYDNVDEVEERWVEGSEIRRQWLKHRSKDRRPPSYKFSCRNKRRERKASARKGI